MKLLDQRIVYKNDDGTIAVIIPCKCGLTISQIAKKDVPTGKHYLILHKDDLPSREFRDAWTIEDEDLTDGVGE